MIRVRLYVHAGILGPIIGQDILMGSQRAPPVTRTSVCVGVIDIAFRTYKGTSLIRKRPPPGIDSNKGEEAEQQQQQQQQQQEKEKEDGPVFGVHWGPRGAGWSRRSTVSTRGELVFKAGKLHSTLGSITQGSITQSLNSRLKGLLGPVSIVIKKKQNDNNTNNNERTAEALSLALSGPLSNNKKRKRRRRTCFGPLGAARRGLVTYIDRRIEYWIITATATKSPFSGPCFVLVLAGIRRLVVQTKAIGKDDLIPL